MKLKIYKNRTTYKDYSFNEGTQNENNSTILEFEFEEGIEYSNKRIVFLTEDGNLWDLINEDNTYKIKNSITKYKKVKAYIWLTDENDNDFRSELFDLDFYDNENPDDLQPSEEQIDGFNTLISQLNLKIEEVEKLSKEVENLNITSERVEDGLEISITKKDGTVDTKKVQDGKDYQITEKDYQEIISRIDIPKKTSDLENDSNFVSDNQYVHTDNNFTDEEKTKLEELQNYDDKEIKEEINIIKNNQQTDESNIISLDKELKGLKSNVEGINDKIPTQATKDNKLADKDYVNSSINSVTAYYITKNAEGDQFENKAELYDAEVYYSGGVERVPTRNDYAIIRVDEDHENSTTRYIFQNDRWEFQYVVNETALTSDQIKALNSGITKELVVKLQGIDLSNVIRSTNKVTDLSDGNLYAKKSEIPTKVSQLENDNDYATKSELPTKTSQLNNDSDFTTKAYVDGIVGDIETLLDTINGEVIQ